MTYQKYQLYGEDDELIEMTEDVNDGMRLMCLMAKQREGEMVTLMEETPEGVQEVARTRFVRGSVR